MKRIVCGFFLIAVLAPSARLGLCSNEKERPELDELIQKLHDKSTSNDAKLAFFNWRNPTRR